MRPLFRAGIALLPLCVAPLLLVMIGDGRIDLGGGEKDLVWILPWVLWSLVYAACSFFLWFRGWPMLRSASRSALVGLAAILLAAALLAAFGELGVGGRF